MLHEHFNAVLFPLQNGKENNTALKHLPRGGDRAWRLRPVIS